jgi:hypothetical protein
LLLQKRQESPSRWSFKGIIHPSTHPSIIQCVNQSLWFICP